MKPIDIVKFVIRILLGGLFITTAVLKLLSINEFELYIYSFELFNFATVAIFSRLLVIFEFLIGIFLIFKVKYTYTWWITLLTMIGFTLFLIYAAIFRNDSNCHCFGELVELDPINSIIKNLITIIFLMLIKGEEDYHFRFKKLIVAILTVVTISLPFVVEPLDSIYNKIYSSHSDLNIPLFEELKQDTTLTYFSIDQGNYLVAFYISGCKYCKLGMKKLHSIVKQNDLDIDKIKIMIGGSEEKIKNFKTDTETENYNFYSIDPIKSMNIVYGSFPTFALVENGKVKKIIDFRGINEEELTEFLK